MKYVISIVLSYLIGGFSPSTLLGRKKGINIRDAGSRNAGASNTFLLIGPKFGIFVALADILKGAICVFLAEIYAPELIHIGVLAGTAAVIGHVFPLHIKFKGGKGVATYLGMMLAIDWPVFLIFGITLVILSFLSNYIITGIFVSVIAYPIFISAYYGDAISAFIVSIASTIVLFKHRSNIQRFLHGEEYRIRQGLMKLIRSKDKTTTGDKQ